MYVSERQEFHVLFTATYPASRNIYYLANKVIKYLLTGDEKCHKISKPNAHTHLKHSPGQVKSSNQMHTTLTGALSDWGITGGVYQNVYNQHIVVLSPDVLSCLFLC